MRCWVPSTRCRVPRTLTLDHKMNHRTTSGKVTIVELIVVTGVIGGLVAGWNTGIQHGMLVAVMLSVVGIPIGILIASALIKTLGWMCQLGKQHARPMDRK